MKVYGVFTFDECLTDFTRNSVIELKSIKEARELFIREYYRNRPNKIKLFLFKDIEDQFPNYKFAFGRTGGIHFAKL